MTVLNKLKVGQKARIKKIMTDPAQVMKLVSLGLMPGDEIEVTGRALFFGPISIKHSNNTFFALRRGHASRINVEVIG